MRVKQYTLPSPPPPNIFSNSPYLAEIKTVCAGAYSNNRTGKKRTISGKSMFLCVCLCFEMFLKTAFAKVSFICQQRDFWEDGVKNDGGGGEGALLVVPFRGQNL